MELNLLARYPKVQRDLTARLESKTDENRAIARQFGREFFDGSRDTGYGGYSYNPRYWRNVAADLVTYYQLQPLASVLDVGCAKGFLLYDLKYHRPDLTVFGIDISEYAVETALSEVKCNIALGCATDLSRFGDKSFDLVISINTVHNLLYDECKQAIREIERVGKNKFIVVDAWRNADEEAAMRAWNLTAQTMLSTKDWEQLFQEVGYTGDYYWFIP